MSLQCWKCGATLTVLLPLSRTETCPSCHADLHTCRMCRHYDAGRAKQCRELAAEPVSDKPRQFLRLVCAAPGCLSRRRAAVAQSNRSALDALFTHGQAGFAQIKTRAQAKPQLQRNLPGLAAH